MNDHLQEPPAPSTTPVQQESARHLLSRRRVLGVGTLAVLGGAVAFWRYHQSQTPMYIYHGQDTGPWEYFTSVAWSPDGKHIGSGGSIQKRIAPGDSADSFSVSWSIRIWDALTGQHMAHYEGLNYRVGNLVWSPDSQRIAFPFGNVQAYVVRVLNAATGTTLLGYPQDVYPQNPNSVYFNQQAAAWSPDGTRIASAGDLIGGTGSSAHSFRLQSWDAHTGLLVRSYELNFPISYLYAVAWSPDGRYLAATGFAGRASATEPTKTFDALQVWDALTGATVFIAPPLGDFLTSLTQYSCSWSPDSQRVVISQGSTAQVWDIARHRLLYTYRGHSNKVTAVAWSPDGTRIASGSWDASVQVWDAKTGERSFSYFGHSGQITGVSWSPDSRYIASSGTDKSVQVWTA